MDVIDRTEQIRRQRDWLLRHYPVLWERMVAQWSDCEDAGDCAWVTYSANYLMRTQGVRWAVDPMTLQGMLAMFNGFDNPHEPFPFEQLCRLKSLSFVLFTHRHSDQMDRGLIRAMREFPIRWIIPQHMVQVVVEHTGLSRDSIIVPQNGVSFSIEGICITPFDGLHWENTRDGREGETVGEKVGIDATGYLIETGKQRLLLPGDVRCYDAASLRWIGPVDRLIAHVWLGRNSASLADPPLLEPFCRFALELQPRRILVAHLNEVCRGARNYWNHQHGQMVTSYWKTHAPHVTVDVPQVAEKVPL